MVWGSRPSAMGCRQSVWGSRQAGRGSRPSIWGSWQSARGRRQSAVSVGQSEAPFTQVSKTFHNAVGFFVTLKIKEHKVETVKQIYFYIPIFFYEERSLSSS